VSASRRLGFAFFGYQGRAVQLTAVATVGMYHIQIAA
jgi:hypothetical protein